MITFLLLFCAIDIYKHNSIQFKRAICSHAPVVGENSNGVFVAHRVAGGAGAEEGLVVVAGQPANQS